MIRFSVCTLLIAGPLLMNTVCAEPYIAVRTGLKCVTCHTNPTGGGKRNNYGNVFAQHTLAARYWTGGSGEGGADSGSDTETWTGNLNRYLGVGADFRGQFTSVDTPGQPDISEYDYEEALLYLELQAVPGLLSLYLDNRLGPGGAQTREAYGLLNLPDSGVYVKAGRFFLPYGLRLEDDDAFTRSVSGISFQTPDDGVELGLETGSWSAQLAVTNGAGGGAEQDDDKRLSLNAVYTRSQWRWGASVNSNETAVGTRDMTAIYGGVRTGRISWLLEYDQITDEAAGGGAEVEQQVSLIEANTLISKGNNLKLTYEVHEPNVDDPAAEDRTRVSLVWEHFPVQYLQFNVGFRSNDGPDAMPALNQERMFAQVHLFF